MARKTHAMARERRYLWLGSWLVCRCFLLVELRLHPFLQAPTDSLLAPSSKCQSEIVGRDMVNQHQEHRAEDERRVWIQLIASESKKAEMERQAIDFRYLNAGVNHTLPRGHTDEISDLFGNKLPAMNHR